MTQLDEERELRFGQERMVFLIDGVFAIAMTLMALEVRLPEGSASFADGWGELSTRLLIYVVAFFIISRFWLVNHRQLRKLHHVNDGVLQCALLFLLGICALPVATNVLFEESDEPEAVVFAAVLLAVTALFSSRLYWYVSSPERGLMDVEPAERRETLFRSGFVVLLYLLAIPLAYALPEPAYATLVWFGFALIDPIADRLAGISRRRPGSA